MSGGCTGDAWGMPGGCPGDIKTPLKKGCCTNADMFKGTNADMFKGTNADLFKGTNADTVFKRTNAENL
jgi:hypothetical protein